MGRRDDERENQWHLLVFVLTTVTLLVAGTILVVIGAVRYNQDPVIDSSAIDEYNRRVSYFETSGEAGVITSTWHSSRLHPNTIHQVHPSSSSSSSSSPDEQPIVNFASQSSALPAPEVRRVNGRRLVGEVSSPLFPPKGATSVFARASMSSKYHQQQETTPTTFAFNFNSITATSGAQDGNNTWERVVPLKKYFEKVPIFCNAESCDRELSTSDGGAVAPAAGTSCKKATRSGRVQCTPSSSELSAACKTLGGPNATYKPSSSSLFCEEGGQEPCGTCSYLGKLSRLCIVVDITMMEDTSSALSQKVSHTKLGCKYPFTDQEYIGIIEEEDQGEEEVISFPVEIRSSDDPVIVLEELTRGSGTFIVGANDPQGQTLLTLGGLSLALGLFGMFIMVLFIFFVPKLAPREVD